MRTPLRYIATPLMYVLISGAFGLLITVSLSSRELVAQTPTELTPSTSSTPSKRAVKPSAKPSAKKALAQGTAAPVRTETVNYDAWTVNCRDTADGKTKKVCSASLTMIMQQENRQIPLGAWIIAHNNEGALLSVLQTPQIDVGVLIAKGIELKFGEGRARKISYLACNPQRCEGTMPMDDATIKESVAAANGAATLTVWKADGSEFAIKIASIKGIDKAIAAVR